MTPRHPATHRCLPRPSIPCAVLQDITRDMMRCKLVPKFALMALLDSLEDFAVIIGTAHTTVALQTLLPQVRRPGVDAAAACCVPPPV